MTLKNIQYDNGVTDIMNQRAIQWAMSPKHEKQVQRALETWHYVKCANCNQWMSLLGAKYNDVHAPMHKKCFGG